MGYGKGFERIVAILQKGRTIIPLLLYFAGVAFFFAHSHIELNFRTYMSENALSPGIVEDEFYEESVLSQYYNTLRKIHKSSEPGDVQKYLVNEMEHIGLDVGRQNYSLLYPELFNLERLSGGNVYGILRSPGTERTEALVLSCWVGEGSRRSDQGMANHAGMAMMLTLAKSFRRRLYWAKDIVFVFTDMNYIGLQAWLLSHHGIESPRLIWDPLPIRSGSIQAALNFEIPRSRFRYLNIKIEGLNGIMPNLDLVNTISLLGQRHNLPMRLHDIKTHSVPSSQAALLLALRTLTRMMMTQATGSPNGQHGLFLPYQIPAVTLSAGITRGQVTEQLEGTARVVEGVMRSLNNLQERFHQSFFFYLLPRIDRYISIGVYMVPFAGVVLPGLLQAILLWLELSKEYESLPASIWWQILPNLIPCVMFGLASYAGSNYFLTSAKVFSVTPPNGLLGGLLALGVSSLFYPWLLKSAQNSVWKSKRKVMTDWRFYKAVMLIVQSLMIGCLGVLNISMAMFVSLLMVPISLIVRPVERRWLRVIVIILQLCAHPICLIIVGISCHNLLRGEDLTLDYIVKTLRHLIVQGFVEQEFLSSWTVRIATLAVFPVWLTFWGLVMA